MKRLQWFFLFPIALALLSAAAPIDPLDLVRAGNAAFARAEYAQAVDFYSRAEETITDPGLAAFNKAAALYRLGDYPEAENYYLRSLQDASGERKARLLFNLGNAVLRQTRGDDGPLLDRAIGYYEDCLRHAGADANLLDDARYNLQVAQAARRKAKKNEQGSENSSPDRLPDRQDDKQQGDRPSRGNEEHGDPEQKGSIRNVEPGAEKDKRHRSRRFMPGVGNLPLVPDEDKRVSLSVEDALDHLHAAAERIARERKQHRQRSLPPASRNVLDW